MSVAVEQHPDLDALISAATDAVVREIDAATHRLGTCRLSLSGGETPRALYARLATPPFLETIPWSRTVWFFDDERWVPHHDPRSNAGMAEAVLFSKAPIPRHQIHPMPTDQATPAAGARAYEQLLRAHFPGVPQPAFDIVIMGLGADGHTASLFPGDAALAEQTWVTSTRSGNPVPDRVTLTLPVFAHARSMVFLVTGDAKAEAVAATLQGPHDPARWPAQAAQPRSGRCVWFVDRAAASRLASWRPAQRVSPNEPR